jgi:glucans biosynthesis protein
MIDRRVFLASGLAAVAMPRPGLADMPRDLVAEARRLSRLPHRDPAMVLPPPFDALSYDSYRAIRPAQGGAAGLPLGAGVQADLLPPGFFFGDRVTVEVETDSGWRGVPFAPDLFTYDARYFNATPVLSGEDRAAMGFSGARLRAPFRDAAVLDEFLVLQGASYFRAVSTDTQYGLSARALAIGTGGAVPEEFPVFTRLRLHRASDGAARVSALLESPSVTGAVTLTARPGAPTVTEMEVTLFPRVTLDQVGIAPLTSMFFKGPLRAATGDDFRPAVHDSDVLRIHNGAGEAVIRPLSNPAALQTSAFADAHPAGFGLIQSARDFADFEDPEALYHRRPSAWVEPLGDWGAGAVMLVEIPTGDEFLDNIVAFWRPEAPLQAGGEYRFAYQIHWGADVAPQVPGLTRIVQTRSGRVHDRPGWLQYVVDFDVADPGTLRPDLSAQGAETDGLSAYPVPQTGHLRVGFQMAPGDAEAVELRLLLRDPMGAARSEVWLHRWTPARDGRP